MIQQISVFLENRAGQLAAITGVLAEAGMDIRALNIAETADYGLLRLITEDTGAAQNLLTGKGFVTSVTPVAAVALQDRPGSLAAALKVLAEAQTDIEYMYSIFSQQAGRAILVMRVQDPEAAEDLLEQHGIHSASPEELHIR